mgnify:CR=1 FL=1
MFDNAEKHADALTKLLPEGLTEASITEIAELIDVVVNEQVDSRVKELESKVKAFIRLNVDSLKEQAMAELEAEESTVRDVKLLESFRTLMALDTSKADVDSAISSVSEEKELREEEVAVLAEELTKVMTENSSLEDSVGVLTARLQKMETDISNSNKKYKTLRESKKPFKSSEKALVIADDVDRKSNKVLEENVEAASNPFINPDTMKFMPFSNKEE